MKQFRGLKYLLAFLLPVSAFVAFNAGYPFTFGPVIYAFALVPLLELVLKPDAVNLAEEDEIKLLNSPFYDWLLYLQVPLQYLNLWIYLKVATDARSGAELFSYTLLMGLLCGVIGINVAHELGHRVKPFERFLAKSLLLTSLYMHFFIEHNRGHHHRVATPDDPASARYGESIYSFWYRSVVCSYRSAWQLEFLRLRKYNIPDWSLRNEMIQYHLIQFGFMGIIAIFFGWKGLLLFLAASLIGALLLESVNYIEHYGLGRQKREDGSFSKTLKCHSWNSDHVIGRILLFELSRHSDHHYKASRKYQVLRHWDESPQMPTGYPGMIILALFPPLWFSIIHPILDKEIRRMPEIILAQ